VKIYSGLDQFVAIKPVVTIGMFDGVHLGHQALIKRTVELANEIGGESVIITFWPHPRLFFNQFDCELQFITSLEEKTQLFSRYGIHHVVIMPFNESIANLTADNFIKNILVDKIHAIQWIVGFNHKIGSDQLKISDHSNEIQSKHNFSIKVMQAVIINNQKASSTNIRNLLLEGLVEKANELLGYRYFVSGIVVGGMRMGRKLNYPTANVQPEESLKLIPKDGVYACCINVLGKRWSGMLNIGIRPTVSKEDSNRSIEVHIFDFENDIYSEEISVEFVCRVRDEIRFDSIEKLIAQIQLDEIKIREILKP